MIRTLLRGRRMTWVAIAVITLIVLITHPFNRGPAGVPTAATTPPVQTDLPTAGSPETRRNTLTQPSPTTGAGDHRVAPTVTVHASSPAAAPPGPSAASVVSLFARAWIRRDLPAQQWWNGIATYTAPSYANQLRTVDPSRIPAAHLTGPPKPTLVRTNLAVYTVGTDTGTLQVTVTPLPGGWKVTYTSWQNS